MTKYIYINDGGNFKIFIEGLIEGFQPIRVFEDERFANMWCRDMNLSYDIGWEHGIQEQIEKDDDELLIEEFENYRVAYFSSKNGKILGYSNSYEDYGFALSRMKLQEDSDAVYSEVVIERIRRERIK